MIANVVVLLTIILLALIWSKYGLFSSVLHFIYVVIAGAITFALWEVTTEALMTVDALADNAWGISSALLFSVSLLTLRVISDKLAKQNMHFDPMVDSLGGGIFGALSGVVTTGILMIACIPYLHFSEAQPLGYGHMVLSGNKIVERKDKGEVIGKLWIPVDTITNAIYTKLSDGAFSPIGGGPTLASARGDLVVNANLYHNSIDPMSKLTVTNDVFQIVRSYEQDLTEIAIENTENTELINLLKEAPSDGRMLVIETQWKRNKLIQDEDFKVRLYPNQIVLLGDTAEGKGYDSYRPVCFTSQVNSESYLTVVDGSDDVAWSENTTSTINFMFALKKGFTPKHLLVSHLRKAINKIDKPDGEEVYDQLILTPHDQAQPVQTVKRGGAKLDDNGVKISNQLPRKFSKSKAKGTLEFQEYKVSKQKRFHLIRGYTEFKSSDKHHSQARRSFAVRTLNPTPQGVWIQTMIEAGPDTTELLKIIRNSEHKDRDHNFVLVEKGGTKLSPIGFVLDKKNRQVVMNIGEEIERAADLPWQKIETGDKLYLFYNVAAGTHLTGFQKFPDELVKIDLRAVKTQK